MDGSPQVVRFDATTLWHFDAAEWAPSTASDSAAPRCPRHVRYLSESRRECGHLRSTGSCRQRIHVPAVAAQRRRESRRATMAARQGRGGKQHRSKAWRCAANCRSTPCSIGVAPCVGSLHRRHQQPRERRDHEQAADRRQQHAADNHAGQRLLHLGADAGGNRGR
jgi:hypothetical protein